jgi:hypothetical protein
MHHACGVTIKFREIFYNENFAKSSQNEISRKLANFVHDFRIFARIEKCSFVLTQYTALLI